MVTKWETKREKMRHGKTKVSLKLSEYKRESVDQLGESSALTALQRRALRRAATVPTYQRNLSQSFAGDRITDTSPGNRFTRLTKAATSGSKRINDMFISAKSSLSMKNLHIPFVEEGDCRAPRPCSGFLGPELRYSSTTYSSKLSPQSQFPDGYTTLVSRSPKSSCMSNPNSSRTSSTRRVSVTSTSWFKDAKRPQRSSVYNQTSLQTIQITEPRPTRTYDNRVPNFEGANNGRSGGSSHIMSECWFRFFLCAFFLLLYMFIGAAVYSKLEHQKEMEELMNMKTFWLNFKIRKNISDSLMKDFLHSHYRTCQHGDKGIHEGQQWDFSSALFFAGTVITTIGYGHATPHTYGGKVFTVVYAYFGIPVMLGLLNVVAEMLLALLRLIKARIKKMQKIFHLEVFLSANVASATIIGIMMLTYSSQETEWSLTDSFYFSFVTMTTIGFGDFVPGQFNSTAKADDSKPKIHKSLYECINLIAYLFAVIVWYFQAHVTAQILKSKMRFLYSMYLIRIKNKGEDITSDEEEDVEAASSDEDRPSYGIPAKRRASVAATVCACTCTCGVRCGRLGDRGQGLNNTSQFNSLNNSFKSGTTNGGIKTLPSEEIKNKLNCLREESDSTTGTISPLSTKGHAISKISEISNSTIDSSSTSSISSPLINDRKVSLSKPEMQTEYAYSNETFCPIFLSKSTYQKHFYKHANNNTAKCMSREIMVTRRLTKSHGDLTVIKDPKLKFKTKSMSSVVKSGNYKKGILKSDKSINSSTVDVAISSSEFAGFQRPFEIF